MARRKTKKEAVEAESLLGSMAESEEELDLPEELEEALMEMQEEMAVQDEVPEGAEDEDADFVEDPEDDDLPEAEVKAAPKKKKPARARKKKPATKKTATKSKTTKAPKAKSTRTKAKAKQEPISDVDEVVEDAVEAPTATDEAPQSESKPKAAPAAKSQDTQTAQPATPSPELNEPAATSKKDETASPSAAPAMVEQWASVKDISDSISKNFERVNDMLKEIPERQKLELQKIAKQTRRAPWASRVAVAASVLAVILSIVSLSLVSSMRRAMIMQQQPAMMVPHRPAQNQQPVQRPPVREARADAPAPSAPAKTVERRQVEAPSETFRKKASVAGIKWRKRGYRPSFHR